MKSYPSRSTWLWLACVICLLPGVALAEPPSPERIPDVLEPWIPWVLDEAGDERCPRVQDVRVCVWPSALELDADDKGATFTLRVTTDRKLDTSLPGSSEQWPLDVRAGKQALAVIDPGGFPQVSLPAGAHEISGRFVWNELPDAVHVPANLGSLSLRVRGTKVSFPKREANGLVWLKQGAGSEEGDPERLELNVQRRIDDGVPLSLTTRIHVSASGKAREVVLPNVLVAGTRPIELRADLPAQLAPDGRLRVQAQAGDYRIEIVAIRETPTERLEAPRTPAPWPEQEIWVFKADDRLRHAELSGAPQIDPTRTSLDADWHGMPAYALGQGKQLAIETRRRGEPEPPPNQIQLQRTLWLDLDGDGYTVSDRLQGALHRNFRLDLLAGTLGHAVVDGSDQLISRHEGASGVELRRGGLSMATEWRLEHARSELPAVGYSEDVDSLSATLHLPPGFTLLAGSGVDQLPGTWVDRWDLFDFFFVLLMALAVGKVAGRAWFAVALFALVLTHHEAEAPALTWLCLLVTTALVRVLKEGRWAKIARAGWLLSLIGLLVIAVPFAVGQVRKALYPHLDPIGDYFGMAGNLAMPTAEAPASAPVMLEEPAPAEDMAAEGGGGLGKSKDAPDWLSGSATRQRQQAPRKSAAYDRSDKNDIDPNAVVQTGPGVPSWAFSVFTLQWSGPVQRDEQVSLWILPPVLTRLWSLLSVLLSGALLYALARALRPAGSSPQPPAPIAQVALLALAACAAPNLAAAQEIPPQDVLQELRARLLKPAECEPSCVAVSRLSLRVDGGRLNLRAEVHAAAAGAYKAPGPLDSWAPDTLRVDAQEAPAAARLDDGFLHVRVGPGLHTVELSGPLPRSQALTLALGTQPHRVEAQAEGFLIEGLRSDGRAEGSLVLRREVALDAAPDGSEQALAPWLAVRREFDLGVRFRVRTVISRLGPARDSLLVRFPLLPGESVTENGLISDRGSVVVELARDQAELSFSSALPAGAPIQLTASQPADASGSIVRPWNETWIVRPSALYRVGFEGLAPVSQLNEASSYEPVYRPWPGEKLTIHADKLLAAQGASVTIDSADASFTPGARMEQSTLTLVVRTSRGTTERVTLPKDSTLVSLQVDGMGRAARVKEGVLELHLDPGAHHVQITLQRPAGIDLGYAPPSYALGRPLANVTTTIDLPNDRWLLWARGPAWGPAVLFWGYLLVVLLAAFALSRVPHSPLKPHEWMLLGLGLTQVNVLAALFVIGWLFALAQRERHPIPQRRLFNLGQVALVLLTLIALGCLAFAVHEGLVVQPDMQVQGRGSTNDVLHWYTDRTTGAFPAVQVWSLPLWIYKGLMLAWALWLAASLLRWLRWGWSAFRAGGGWRPKPRPPENPRVPLDQIGAAQAELDANSPAPSTPEP